MFRNYLKIAARNLIKSRLYTSINILGLSIGIACCVLIFFFIKKEFTFDTFHENADSIFEMLVQIDSETSNYYFETVPSPLAAVLTSDFPGIEESIRLKKMDAIVKKGDQVFEENLLLADANIFSMFSFGLLQGDESTALSSPNSVVISQKMAEKYFGKADPVGQPLTLKVGYDFRGQVVQEYTVNGVVDRIPNNSSIQFDILIPFENIRYWWTEYEHETDWTIGTNSTFIRIAGNSARESVESTFPNFTEKYGLKVLFSSTRKSSFNGTLTLRKITDLHFTSRTWQKYYGTIGKRSYSYILGGIACIILLVACINFMNISIGQSVSRAREVGMRKVMGAQRRQVLKQFLTETVFLSLLSLFIGLFIAELALPYFNALANQDLELTYFSNISTVVFLVLLIVSVGVFAGSYPALIVSGFQPVTVLKGLSKFGGNNLFTRSLIVFQFSLSVILIIGTIFMYNQLNHLKQMELGFNTEQIVELTIPTADSESSYTAFTNEIRNHHGIVSLTSSAGTVFSPKASFFRKGEKTAMIYKIGVDYEYLNTLGLQLVQGRGFSEESASDFSQSALVNETFVRENDLRDPIGKVVLDGNKNPKIIGVVKDFYFESLSRPIQPFAIVMPGASYFEIDKITMRLRPENVSETLPFIETQWKKFYSETPFEFTFLDEKVQLQYRSDENWGKIIGTSTLLAILIAGLGLFGVTSLSVTRRTKEIGIRKTLGGTVGGLVGLVNGEFVKLIIISNIIAWPIAYFSVNKWLQGFSSRIAIEPYVFVLSLFIIVTIAVVTISIQALKAALANPVQTLRYE